MYHTANNTARVYVRESSPRSVFPVRSTDKGKAIPLEAWTDPGVPGVRGSQISRQSAHEFGQPYATAAFTTEKASLVLISVRG